MGGCVALALVLGARRRGGGAACGLARGPSRHRSAIAADNPPAAVAAASAALLRRGHGYSRWRATPQRRVRQAARTPAAKAGRASRTRPAVCAEPAHRGSLPSSTARRPPPPTRHNARGDVRSMRQRSSTHGVRGAGSRKRDVVMRCGAHGRSAAGLLVAGQPWRNGHGGTGVTRAGMGSEMSVCIVLGLLESLSKDASASER